MFDFGEIAKSLGSELLEKAKSMEKLTDQKQLDMPLAKSLENTGKYNEYKNVPINNGRWENKDGTEGRKGDSTWKPDRDYVPQSSNPEGKTWGKILDEFNIDGIPFHDGEPDFSEVSKGKVTIEGFSSNRDDNFDKADQKLAEQRGCTPPEVAKWRKEHGYTWHECSDMKTMQKVPSIIHGNVSHRGGISKAKEGGY